LTWNGQYQLTEVTTNGSECERNGYDVFGRRVWLWDGAQTNYVVYDGIQALADVNATGGLVRSYVWGPGVDNLLAMTVYTGTTVKTYFALTDHQKSVHTMVDETGNVVEQYRFDAWGRTTAYDGGGVPITQSAIGNRYVWQGREISWVTGLYNFRLRIYDPISGRFLSKDPSGISAGLNEFLFCRDNPVNRRDPLGLQDRRDNNVAAQMLYGEISSLRPTTDEGPGDANDLWAAMQQIAGIIKYTDRRVAKPRKPDCSEGEAIFADCLGAVEGAGDPGDTQHFVIWPSANGKVPDPGMKAYKNWPYTQAPKITDVYGPFYNTEKKRNEYIFFYTGVP
jgi:RHS repeat-associated protein